MGIHTAFTTVIIQCLSMVHCSSNQHIYTVNQNNNGMKFTAFLHATVITRAQKLMR